MPYTLPPLPYDYAALEPHIDAETMRLHHDKHHQAYIDAVNKALEPYPQFSNLIVEDLLRRLNDVPEEIRATVRNNGGGHANHQFFWKVIGPPIQDAAPEGELSKAIVRDFNSFDTFQTQFTEAASKHFGSGWAFLAVDPNSKKLEIVTTPNQDSVILQNKPGLLACDVWEHSYYLKYQNRRPDYLKAWWNVVNWPAVSTRYQHFLEGKQQL